jgi:hypothetical protein
MLDRLSKLSIVRLFGMMLAGFTLVLWMQIHDNVHLSENRHILFTGVSTISEAHAGSLRRFYLHR